MVVHVGPDFSRRLEAGMPAEVQLILDGRRSNAAQIVAGYASAIMEGFDRELAATHRSPPPPSVVAARVWFNPNLETTWNTVPALVAVLTTLMGLVVTALSVARERELGTFEQLLVSPLDPHEIVIGKTVPSLIIGLAEGTLMILVGVFVFRVPFQGSVVLLYVAMTIYLASVIGVGLFISSLAMTQQQGILGAFVFMVPAILLSGFATPIENMPQWLQTFTLANPLRYYMIIMKGLFLKGMPAAMVLQLLWPLGVIAIVTLSGATWLFRRRVEWRRCRHSLLLLTASADRKQFRPTDAKQLVKGRLAMTCGICFSANATLHVTDRLSSGQVVDVHYCQPCWAAAQAGPPPDGVGLPRMKFCIKRILIIVASFALANSLAVWMIRNRPVHQTPEDLNRLALLTILMVNGCVGLVSCYAFLSTWLRSVALYKETGGARLARRPPKHPTGAISCGYRFRGRAPRICSRLLRRGGS